MTFWGRPNADAIIEDQVFLGNLAAAQSNDFRSKLEISHILSICHEYPSTGPNHLIIPVSDLDHEDLLTHLPQACQFIQTALDDGGKVLVHCGMGVSRSPAVVCAYLMLMQHLSTSDALKLVKERRPRAYPNNGFMRQLEIFEKCSYQPSPTHEAYILWKRERDDELIPLVSNIDVEAIVSERFFVIILLPFPASLLGLLLSHYKITHFVSMTRRNYHHLDVPGPDLPAICKHIDLDSDPYNQDPVTDACKFIENGVESGGKVLLYNHSDILERSAVVCAYLMLSQNMDFTTAFKTVKDVLRAGDSDETPVRRKMQHYFDQVLLPRGIARLLAIHLLFKLHVNRWEIRRFQLCSGGIAESI